MQIIRCDRSHDEAWNRFVSRSPRASFYHRAEWRGINEDAFAHETAFLAAVEGEAIVGVLPLVRLKSLLFGNVACSMPFVNYGGPCGESDAVEEALLDRAAAIADQWRVDYVEFRSRHRLADRYPCSEHKVSMTVALDPDPEVVMNGFKREQRAEIRRAYKQGFTAKFGPELLEDFYGVLSASWRDLGTPIFSVDYLKRIVAALPDAVRICVVYDEAGRPAAGAFDGIHNGTVEGMWLGVHGDYRKKLVGYVLYWELIREACTRGCRSFHLGRSSRDSGGEQFKRKWNAEAVPLYWHYMLRSRNELPSLNPSNPRYRLAIEAWRKLPLPMTQMLGPFIARSIP